MAAGNAPDDQPPVLDVVQHPVVGLGDHLVAGHRGSEHATRYQVTPGSACCAGKCGGSSWVGQRQIETLHAAPRSPAVALAISGHVVVDALSRVPMTHATG